MYTNTLPLNIDGSESAMTEPVERYGVLVYVESHPDYASCDFKIDPADTVGLAIFREFAAKIHEHYKSLKP
jgi:hypothetical protein